MRILIATRCNFISGGVETYLQVLIPALRQRGHDVALAYEREASFLPPLDASGEAPGWLLQGGGALPAIEAWAPDVAYIQGLGSPEVENALLDRFPSVAYVHNYAATCISGAKSRRFPLRRACDRRLGPACLALYLPCGCGGRNPVTMLRAYRAAVRSRAALARYELVLVASPHMLDECRKNGVAGARLRTLALFAPSGPASPTPPRARGTAGTNVLFVGRLTAVKGGVELVEAVAHGSRALGRPLRLDIAGDGPEREAVASLAERLGVRIHLHGWVARETVVRLMHDADVLAIPSVWPEPFGLVGIEAGGAGLPSVGFATGGIPGWLLPGISGEIAPGPPSATALAGALVRAMRDPAHLDSLRLGAWRASQHFSQERHLRELETILANAARKPASAGKAMGAVSA